jgi:hypothetical protein
MIGHCFNPECNEELRYLRQGSVYQWETGVGREFHSEFFWLCPTCSSRFMVASDDNGEPLLVPCSSKRDGDQKCSRIRRVLRGVLQECVVADLPGAVGVGPSGSSVTAGS